MEKKKCPYVSRRNIVIIPVGKSGSVYTNALYLLDIIDKWYDANPGLIIEGNPNFNVTPSSSGRGVSIDSISFTWKMASK